MKPIWIDCGLTVIKVAAKKVEKYFIFATSRNSQPSQN